MQFLRKFYPIFLENLIQFLRVLRIFHETFTQFYKIILKNYKQDCAV